MLFACQASRSLADEPVADIVQCTEPTPLRGVRLPGSPPGHAAPRWRSARAGPSPQRGSCIRRQLGNHRGEPGCHRGNPLEPSAIGDTGHGEGGSDLMEVRLGRHLPGQAAAWKPHGGAERSASSPRCSGTPDTLPSAGLRYQHAQAVRTKLAENCGRAGQTGSSLPCGARCVRRGRVS
jgi:hypothetical protein